MGPPHNPSCANAGRARRSFNTGQDQPVASLEDNLIPCAIDAELSLLGAILHNNAALDRARDYVHAEDFVESINQHIFRVMCLRRDEGELIDFGLMKTVLGNADLDGITPGEYMCRLMRGATTISGAADYARLIFQASQMRQVLDVGQAAVVAMKTDSVFDPAGHAAQMIEQLDQVVSAKLSESVRRITLKEGVDQVLASVERLRHTSDEHGALYGIPSLDRATLGMRKGQLIVLAGRTAMGKTATALHFALSTARRSGAVGFISLEMSGSELSERLLAALAFRTQRHADDELSYRAIAQARDLTDEDLRRLDKARAEAGELPIYIEQQPELTLAQIRVRARQMKLRAERTGVPFSVLIVDHMGLVKPSARYSGNRVQEMGEISSGLKSLAKELGVPVLGLCQLNRAVESRDDKRPTLADLRDSGSIEQDADVVLGLYREAYYLENKADRSIDEEKRLARKRSTLEVGILKQRSGPTMRIECVCNIACNILAERAT